MTRRDWWFGIGALVLAVLLHALLPRYEWRDPGGDDVSIYVRIDRWTGRAEMGAFFNKDRQHTSGRWMSLTDLQK